MITLQKLYKTAGLLIMWFAVVLSCDSRTITYYSDTPGGSSYPGPDGVTYVFLDFSGVNITDDNRENVNIALSPDEDLLIYQSGASLGIFDIYSISVTGIKKSLTNIPANDVLPVISPDGGKIAFFRNSDAYIMNIDGSGQQMISKTELDIDNPLRFTRDGQRVVATSINNGKQNISLIEIDGGGQVNLTPAIGGYNANVASNIDKIVFVSGEENGQNIFTMNYSGNELQNLTSVPGSYRDPSFSPNGTTLAFSKLVEITNYYNIYKISSQGPPFQQLTTASSFDVTPVFTPDGKWIAFNRISSGNSDIVFISLDGLYEVNFTNTVTGVDLLPVFSKFQPVMYFQSNVDGDFDIYVSSLELLPSLGSR